MAPPPPQGAPTGRPLPSSALPCASKVLRPSDCHLEVAPTTTATCLPFEFVLRFWLIGHLSLFVCGVRTDGEHVPPPGSESVAATRQDSLASLTRNVPRSFGLPLWTIRSA